MRYTINVLAFILSINKIIRGEMKMKPLKLTSIIAMLFIAISITAQEEYYDDVYFSSGKTKKTKVEEKKAPARCLSS